MTARRRRLAPLLAAASVLTLAVACTSSDDAATPGAGTEVKIGLLAPLKGGERNAGIEAQRGAALAADIINGLNPSINGLPLADGAGLPNFGGARVKIVPADTSGDDPQAAAVSAVTKLVATDGVDALVGAYDPQVTEFASQRSERYEVPFVNADSPAPYLTDRGLDWFFRLGPSWRSAGEAFFSLLRTQQGTSAAPLPKILVLHPDDKAGRDVYTTVLKLAQEGGFAKPGEQPFSPTATDLGDVVQAVQNANPDVVMLYSPPATVQPLINAFAIRQYRPKAVLSFGLGFLTTENYRASAAVVTGLARSVSWASETADRNPSARKVADLYQQRYDAPMSEEAAATFTAVMTVAQAVNAARSVDPAKVRTALLSLDVPGEQTVMPWGGVQFDETHQNVRAQVLVEQFLGGSFKLVYPSDAASSQLIYPADKARTNNP